MISSMFRWRGGRSGEDEDEEEVLVNIESPAANIRRISSSIVINRPPTDVWRILTDYEKCVHNKSMRCGNSGTVCGGAHHLNHPFLSTTAWRSTCRT
jgi:hypothetical protein